MADLLREVTTWVSTGTGWVIGTELFAGKFPPEEQDEAVVILESGGPPEQILIDRRVGRYMFQVLCRGSTYFSVRDNAVAAMTYLHELAQQVIGEWEVLTSEAITQPQFIGYDERGRVEFSTNYELRAVQVA